MANCLEVMKQSRLVTGDSRAGVKGWQLLWWKTCALDSTSVRVTKPADSEDMLQKFNEMIVLAIQFNAGKLLSNLGGPTKSIW